MWLWAMDPTDDSHSAFNIHRDIIYGATALLGVGEAACIVISFAMITQLIGKFTVSDSSLLTCTACMHLQFPKFDSDTFVRLIVQSTLHAHFLVLPAC